MCHTLTSIRHVPHIDKYPSREKDNEVILMRFVLLHYGLDFTGGIFNSVK